MTQVTGKPYNGSCGVKSTQIKLQWTHIILTWEWCAHHIEWLVLSTIPSSTSPAQSDGISSLGNKAFRNRARSCWNIRHGAAIVRENSLTIPIQLRANLGILNSTHIPHCQNIRLDNCIVEVWISWRFNSQMTTLSTILLTLHPLAWECVVTRNTKIVETWICIYIASHSIQHEVAV